MQNMQTQGLAKMILDSNYPVFICGAGISYGAAPLAKDVHEGILSAAAYIAASDKENFSFSKAAQALKHAEKDYLTLEMLVSGLLYRVPALREALNQLYDNIFWLKKVNRSNRALAEVVCAKKLPVILTANFDDGLFSSLDSLIANYQLVTDSNVEGKKPPDVGENSFTPAICAYHGTVYKRDIGETISRPTSMTARELAHPFMPAMAEYMMEVFERADKIFFIGHRGEDFYDMNVCISSYINSNNSEKNKFFCVPHRGDIRSVSEFFIKDLGPQSIIILNDSDDEWLADVCDFISGVETKKTSLDNVRADQVEAKLVELARNSLSEGDMKVAARQCQAFLDDIRYGVLAVWSITEHYRLESLALSQSEISAFGRPPEDMRYFSIPILNLLAYQKGYQKFRDELRRKNLSPDQVAHVLVDGVRLFFDLHIFAENCRSIAEKLENCRSISKTAERGIDIACCLLMTAIAYDYMGLIAMRFKDSPMRFVDEEPYLSGMCDANSLFTKSVAVAEEAGQKLSNEKHLAISSSDEYLKGLGELVAWEIWAIAPEENRLRLDEISLLDRVKGFQEVIEKRINLMKSEAEKGEGNTAFSVAGHAAQCSQRISELMRLIGFGRNKEDGVPDFSELDGLLDTPEIVRKAEEWAEICLKIGKEKSSHKNFRFMAAYDALILAALSHQGGEGRAKELLKEAETYADGDKNCTKRLDQLRTRLNPLV
ncbi:MAG: hypothetical protein GVY13_01200 [Alphaproteobacteria bacterium]|jgi:hypothetical protein|nr:hypothetical protein [Alphaproteobacteria bacterium]